MSTLGKSQTLDFSITATGAVDIVVIFGLRTAAELEKWSYPARIGYKTLELDTSVFSGVLSEAATKTANSGNLVMDVKIWDVNGKTLIKRFNIANIADTFVKLINKTA